MSGLVVRTATVADLPEIVRSSMMTRIEARRFYECMGWNKSHAGFKLQLEQP